MNSIISIRQPLKHSSWERINFKFLYFYLLLIGPIAISLSLSIFTSGSISNNAIRIQVLSSSFSLIGLAMGLVGFGRYIKQVGLLVLIAGHFVWFAIPSTYQILTSGLWFGTWTGMPVSNDAIFEAGLQIQIFLAANVIAYFWIMRKIQDIAPISNTKFVFDEHRRDIIILIAFIIGLLPYILLGGGLNSVISGILSGRSDKAWALSAGNAQAYEGNSVMTLFWLTRGALISAGILAGSYLVSNTLNRIFRKVAYAFAFSLTIFILYFDQGTRSALATLIVPVLIVWIFQRTDESNHQASKIRLLLSILTAGCFLVLLTQSQLYYRLFGLNDRLSDVTVQDLVATKSQTDFYTETAYAVELKRLSGGENIIESPISMFVTNLVPRVLWSGKPRSEIVWWYSLYRWNGHDIWQKGGNALPSVVGQYYLIFGTVGVLWAGLLFGGLAGWFSSLMANAEFENYLFALSGITVLFVSFRFFGPGFHYATLLLGFEIVLYKFLFIDRNRYPA